MKWQGIRRDSIDIGTAEAGLGCINARFKVDGEMRRRRGMARTNIVKKGAAVVTLNGFSPFQSQTMAALTDGDRWQGYARPAALWGDNGAGFELYGNYPGYNGITVIFVYVPDLTIVPVFGSVLNVSSFVGARYAGEDDNYYYFISENFEPSSGSYDSMQLWWPKASGSAFVRVSAGTTITYVQWGTPPASTPLGTWSTKTVVGAGTVTNDPATIDVSGSIQTSGTAYVACLAASDVESNLGWFSAGTHTLSYYADGVQFSATSYCATRNTAGSVKLQVWHDDAWHDFSDTSDESTMYEEALYFAEGKTYEFTITSPQQVKLRFVGAAYADTVRSVSISYTVSLP